ncbi:MAG: hypothetical protein Q4F69_02390 [Bacteroidia bacterium]|nr:hypothetical protein [Bacteroidia bacterium]
MMKNKNITYIILFVIFVAVLALPALQTQFKLFELKPLNGETEPVEIVPTFENYKSNVLQNQIDDYLKEHFGFREILIPYYNQYIWDVFNKIENNGIFLGKNNWLFFYEHLCDQFESLTYKYADSGEEMTAIFERDAKATYYLQEILKEYGITLFIGIAPSKNELYPEFLPENKRFKHTGGVWADAFYTKRFKELGVNCLDFNTIYKGLKDSVDYPLFYKSSSHYSMISAAYETDTLIKYMESISGLNIQNVEFDEPHAGEARKIDKDMEKLFNLIRPIEDAEYKYLNVKTIHDETAAKPHWLTVGDSFFWNLINSIPHAEIFNGTPFWYYNKEVYFDPGHKDVSEVNLLEELLKSDIIMIYWCPINLYRLEHGFVINALISLCYEDNYLEEKKNKIVQNIKANQEWYDAVIKQAEKKGISMEQALNDNADYTMKENYEEYFPEIFGDSVPAIRNSRIKKLAEDKKQR